MRRVVAHDLASVSPRPCSVLLGGQTSIDASFATASHIATATVLHRPRTSRLLRLAVNQHVRDRPGR
jgi:hypothetical protein